MVTPILFLDFYKALSLLWLLPQKMRRILLINYLKNFLMRPSVLTYEMVQQMIQTIEKLKPLWVPLYIKSLKSTILVKPSILSISIMTYNEQMKINEHTG